MGLMVSVSEVHNTNYIIMCNRLQTITVFLIKSYVATCMVSSLCVSCVIIMIDFGMV